MGLEMDIPSDEEIRAAVEATEWLGWHPWADGDTAYGTVTFEVSKSGDTLSYGDPNVTLICPEKGVHYPSQARARMRDLAGNDSPDASLFRATVRDPFQDDPALPFLHDEGAYRGTLTDVTILGRYTGSFLR